MPLRKVFDPIDFVKEHGLLSLYLYVCGGEREVGEAFKPLFLGDYLDFKVSLQNVSSGDLLA